MLRMFTHVNYTLEFGVSSHMFGEEIRSDLLLFLYIFFCGHESLGRHNQECLSDRQQTGCWMSDFGWESPL